jgi:hypothetical protein
MGEDGRVMILDGCDGCDGCDGRRLNMMTNDDGPRWTEADGGGSD